MKQQTAPPAFPYRWFWRKRLPERRGQLLRVICRGTMNSRLVEFEDGFRAITSGNALRKARTTRQEAYDAGFRAGLDGNVPQGWHPYDSDDYQLAEAWDEGWWRGGEAFSQKCNQRQRDEEIQMKLCYLGDES